MGLPWQDDLMPMPSDGDEGCCVFKDGKPNSVHTRIQTKQRCHLCSSRLPLLPMSPATPTTSITATFPVHFAAFPPPSTAPQHGEPVGGSVEEGGGSHYPLRLLHSSAHSCKCG
jgi:hypothetical protein